MSEQSTSHRSAPSEQLELPEVLHCLVREHQHFSALLDQIEKKTEQVSPMTLSDYYLLRDIVGYMHDYPIQVHHPTETLVFERLQQRRPKLSKTIRAMFADHEEVAAETEHLLFLLEQIIQKAGREECRAVRTACNDFARHQRQHMQIENLQLFPVALKALSDEDWESLVVEYRAADDPLFGPLVARRHRVLFEYLLGATEQVVAKTENAGWLSLERFSLAFGTLQQGRDAYFELVRVLVEQLGEETSAAAQQVLKPPGVLALMTLPARFATGISKSMLRGSGDLLKISTSTARMFLGDVLSISRRKG